MFRQGLILLCTVLIASTAVAAPPTTAAEDLAAGIAQVKRGDLDEAVVTLDGVVHRLVAEKAQGHELARAYSYLAIAYMGLSQRVSARASFLEAWKADKTLTLSPKEFPAEAIALFEDTRREAEGGGPAAETKGGGHGKTLLIGGAVLGAAGAGVLIATGGGHPNITGTWTGDMVVSGFRCTPDITCPGYTEHVVWDLTETQEAWSALAQHTLVSYESGSVAVCSNGNPLPAVGRRYGYQTHGSIRWPKVLRDDALSIVFGGCSEYRVDGSTMTASCTITQGSCTLSEVWSLTRP